LGDDLKRMNKKNKDKENGQAVVEFALVLPLFLLLIFAIIEFGWVFYNYISVENAARNAARIACVEYEDIAQQDTLGSGTDLTFADLDAYYNVKNAVDSEGKSTYDSTKSNSYYQIVSDDEADIITSVKNTVSTLIPEERYQYVKINVKYTYDESFNSNGNNSFSTSDRYKGDVEVTVSCDVSILTGFFNYVFNVHDGSDSKHDKGTITVRSHSVYKVEKQYSADADSGS
jgi:Flp pilus assembly protein TadG